MKTKNIFKLIGIAALALAMIFSLSSCGGDDDNGGGAPALGSLTITGIPQEHRGSAWASAVGTNSNFTIVFLGGSSLNVDSETWHGTPIPANGTVTLTLWALNEHTEAVIDFPATGTFYFELFIDDRLDAENAIVLDSRVFMNISFSNGSATVAWSAGTPTTGADARGTQMDRFTKR